MARHRRSLPRERLSERLRTAAGILRGLDPALLAGEIDRLAERLPHLDAVLENGAACLAVHGHVHLALAQANLIVERERRSAALAVVAAGYLKAGDLTSARQLVCDIAGVEGRRQVVSQLVLRYLDAQAIEEARSTVALIGDTRLEAPLYATIAAYLKRHAQPKGARAYAEVEAPEQLLEFLPPI
jgi:hypothetical protein